MTPNHLDNFEDPGWQKMCEGTKGLRRKIWSWTKMLCPNICYFVANYALFGNLWEKKCFFWVKDIKYAFDEKFYGHFCPRQKAAKFCHP